MDKKGACKDRFKGLQRRIIQIGQKFSSVSDLSQHETLVIRKVADQIPRCTETDMRRFKKDDIKLNHIVLVPELAHRSVHLEQVLCHGIGQQRISAQQNLESKVQVRNKVRQKPKIRSVISKLQNCFVSIRKSAVQGERFVSSDEKLKKSGRLPREETKTTGHISVGISSSLRDTKIPSRQTIFHCRTREMSSLCIARGSDCFRPLFAPPQGPEFVNSFFCYRKGLGKYMENSFW